MNFVKNSLKNLLAFSVSISIGLLIGEFIVRMFFPQITSPVQFFYDEKLGGMVPVPNQKGFKNHPDIYHYEYQNNEIGMRDTRQLADYKHIPYKILCLGDSFTYGWGVNDNETFSNVLEKKINQDLIAVLNAGSSGAGTDYALKFFRVRGKELSPKIVIYFYFENDREDNLENRYFTIKNDSIISNNVNEFASINAVQKNKLANSKLYNWFSSNSHLFSMIRFQVGLFWIKKVKKENETKNTSVLEQKPTKNSEKETKTQIPTENKFKPTYKYLKALSEEVNKSGATFYAFFIPSHLSTLDFQKHGKIYQEDSLSSFCLKNNINFYSFKQTLFKNKDPYHAYYFPVDFHWNKDAHMVAGVYIYEILKKDGVLPQKK